MKQTPLNLHDLLRSISYDHAVICTYTFDPIFFEEYCLEKFNSLKTNGNITVIVDYETYFHAITGPSDNRPKQANIRYLFHPISVPGRFHAKLFLLVSRNKGRLVIGSANFTKPGIISNAELVNYYDYETEKNEDFKPLFQTAFTFLNKLSQRSPINALTSNLKNMELGAPWLVAERNTEYLDQEMIFLGNLERPLWEQILSQVDSPVDTIHILSRYFDLNATILDRVAEDLNPRKIKIYTQNGITTMTNEWLKHPLFKDRTLEIYLCSYADEGHVQHLHAKAIAIERSATYSLAFGSANFTTPALMKNSENGNIEILLLLRNIPTKEFEPAQLIDPLGNSRRIQREGDLQSAPRQISGSTQPIKLIQLYDAELLGNKILAKTRIKPQVSYDSIQGRIQFQDEAYSRVNLHLNHDEEYFSDPVENIMSRLGDASSILTIEAHKDGKMVAESNPILITNLLDIRTGQHVRRERYIREAYQSAIDFFRVLDGLIKEGDEEPLINFFNYCDIPIMDVSRPVYARGIRPIWDGGKGMRSLGPRNLKIFKNLHDAAMNFYDRHFKKLQSHVERGSINGVANYLHIFLAMGGVLRAQIERLLQGFEACDSPIPSDDWYSYRVNIDTYFSKFKELTFCLHDQYLPGLLKFYTSKTLRERFAPDLQPLEDLCKDMLSFHTRMEALSKSKLRIITQNRVLLIPPFFQDNVFMPANWTHYQAEQANKMNHVLRILSA